MPRALEIPIEVTRLDRAQDSVRRLSASVRGVGDASRGSAETLQRSWSSAMERIARDQERYLRVSGPAQRLQRAVASREAARESGDAARIFDAEAAVARATVGMQRARRQQALTGGGGFTTRLTGVLASTRFNAGPVSPLIGRAAELAGIPMVGGAGLAFAGAGLAIGGFVAAVTSATKTLNEFGETMRQTGGTAREVAGMRRFGLTAQDAAGFRQRIATDPMAQMFAARLGVRALPRPFGEVNEAGTINRAVEGLRKMTDAEERLRAARELGLESTLKYLDASPAMQALLDEQARFEEGLQKGVNSANDLAIANEALNRSWQNLLAVAATPVLEGLADDLQRFAYLFQGNFGMAFRDDDEKTITQQHTDAMKDHTDALKEAALPPGTYGGGPRTAKAMPTGWAGDFLNRNTEAGALSKGMPGV